MTPHAQALTKDARGAVMVEFLVAFVPVFVLFLGSVQLLLIAVADLVVRHAAITGARAAVVVLSDEARFYAGERPGSVASDGQRLSAIRGAVSFPLAAIAPEPQVRASLGAGTPTTLASELGSAPATRFASTLASDDTLWTAVTFPVTPGKPALHQGSVPTNRAVTLRATHLFRCGVPLAATLICSTFAQLELASALHELERAPTNTLREVLRVSSARFRVLRAEATLPSQHAAYVDRQTDDDGR